MPLIGTSDLAADGTSDLAADGTSDLAADGTSDLAADGTSDLAADGTSDLAADGTSDLAADGTSDLAADGTSDLAADGTSDLAAPKVVARGRWSRFLAFQTLYPVGATDVRDSDGCCREEGGDRDERGHRAGGNDASQLLEAGLLEPPRQEHQGIRPGVAA